MNRQHSTFPFDVLWTRRLVVCTYVISLNFYMIAGHAILWARSARLVARLYAKVIESPIYIISTYQALLGYLSYLPYLFGKQTRPDQTKIPLTLIDIKIFISIFLSLSLFFFLEFPRYCCISYPTQLRMEWNRMGWDGKWKWDWEGGYLRNWKG